MPSSHDYVAAINPARKRFEDDPSVRAIFGGELDRTTFLATLLYFNALGIAMTEPVERWIMKSGVRCKEIGMPALGRALEKSSKLEAAHHRMMIDDATFLVGLWNHELPAFPLRVESILATPPTRGVDWYCAVHEEYLAGPMPFVQVAFMQEIERLAEGYGAMFVASAKRILGPGAAQGLSFVHFHIANDVGHAALSHKLLDDVLRERPDSLPQLVATGEKAIDSYRLFLADAVTLGRELVANMGR
ncbi:MAG: hypothetical protein HOO96_19250 [Polyangiaceae bacterium]|nr:hypothetical protein [Polyangiaceae bacterium]